MVSKTSPGAACMTALASVYCIAHTTTHTLYAGYIGKYMYT